MSQKQINILIQGGYGAFHEQAAKDFFTNYHVNVIPCETFSDLFEELKLERYDCAIVAVENTVAGSLLGNHTLIHECSTPVVGEHYLRVVQNLMTLPGESIDSIDEVFSHPIAIQQCSLYLNKLRKKGVKITDTIDTALSAKMIRECNLRHKAAVAGIMAAERYNLSIIANSIENSKRNFTRFLILSSNKQIISHIKSTAPINKVSLCFTLPHTIGGLSRVLSVLAAHKMNLTKILSLPIAGKEWDYLFYLDMVFHDISEYKIAIKSIGPYTQELKVLGEYSSGSHFIQATD